MKKLISDTLSEPTNKSILNSQVKQEYLKYIFRKHTINFSEKLAKRTNKKIADLEQNSSILKNMKTMIT